MSYEDPKRSQQPREQARQSAQAASQSVIAPGKRTRTMNLPSPPANTLPAVQQKPDPMTDAARQEQRALTARWIDTAVRPDLYSPPVQLERMDEGTVQSTQPASGGRQSMPGAGQAISSLSQSLSAPPQQVARESVAGSMTEGAQIEDAAGDIAVQTVIRPGAAPQVSAQSGGARAAPVVADALDEEIVAHNAVAPGGAPTMGAGANDCVPSTASAIVTWEVVDDGTDWRANVTALTLAGRIRINPWPSRPTDMVVPNTPNPVDGGNINNTAGSPNHWQAVIDDMADYDTAGGGAGPNWHSTAASTAHEWAHWNQDYVGDAVTSASGGNWSATNARIDALREPKANSATAADARAALEPRVNAEIATWRRATIVRWNTLVSSTDRPGSGGRGYAAGAAVLATHIAAVRAYQSTKGW